MKVRRDVAIGVQKIDEFGQTVRRQKEFMKMMYNSLLGRLCTTVYLSTSLILLYSLRRCGLSTHCINNVMGGNVVLLKYSLEFVLLLPACKMRY